jgi:hypothetical protein
VLRAAREHPLDNLTTMLLKFDGKIEWRNQKALADERIDQVDQLDVLVSHRCIQAEWVSVAPGTIAIHAPTCLPLTLKRCGAVSRVSTTRKTTYTPTTAAAELTARQKHATSRRILMLQSLAFNFYHAH